MWASYPAQSRILGRGSGDDYVLEVEQDIGSGQENNKDKNNSDQSIR